MSLSGKRRRWLKKMVVFEGFQYRVPVKDIGLIHSSLKPAFRRAIDCNYCRNRQSSIIPFYLEGRYRVGTPVWVKINEFFSLVE